MYFLLITYFVIYYDLANSIFPGWFASVFFVVKFLFLYV